MCLLVLAWNVHPRYRLVLAANRDEFHERPAEAMAWWPDGRLVAGRDLQAGGTWLAVGDDSHFGVVTNYRDLQGPLAGAPSRGQLIPEFLDSREPAPQFAERLAPQIARYSGFNLLVGDTTRLSYIANRAAQPVRELPAGVFGLSNHLLDTPWPKLMRTRAHFEEIIAGETLAIEDLFTMLTDREPSQEQELQESGLPRELERALSAPFIVNERYGTRSSTVLLVGHDGAVGITEQRYDPLGRVTGRAAVDFQS